MLERICRFLHRLAPPCGNWRVVTDLWPTLKFIRRDFGGPIVFAKSLPTGGAWRLSALSRPFMVLFLWYLYFINYIVNRIPNSRFKIPHIWQDSSLNRYRLKPLCFGLVEIYPSRIKWRQDLCNVFCAWLITSLSAWVQLSNGSISGRVRDKSVLPER